jgi:hypothetical protein
MKRLITVVVWMIVAVTAGSSHADATQCADLAGKAAARCELPASFEVQHTSATSDVLQAVGQAVLKKAVRAGWAELSSKLSELAGCSAQPPKLPSTCDVLGQARIEDLIASPRILLNAFVTDLLRTLSAQVKSLQADIGVAVAGLAAGWVAVGPDAITRHVEPWLKAQLSAHAADVACPSSKAAAVAWVLGECYVNSTSQQPIGDLINCKLDERLQRCTFDDQGKTEVRQVAEIAITTIKAINDNPKGLPELEVQLFFEWSKLADDAHKALLDHLETIFLGLIEHDWTRIVVGIGQIAADVNTKDCDEDKHACTIGMKLVRIVGAIGQFAETYTSTSKTTDPGAAREKVIEDLLTSLVDRSERDHGAVVSLGGALGLLGGARFNASGSEFALPARLTLGLGLQTYGSGTSGFHLSLDAFDLGQYVTYSQSSLDVASPDVRSVIVAGATVGFWFHNRETPLFVAVHGSVSPFVRSTDGKPTYELGAMFGVYVPLLDFN